MRLLLSLLICSAGIGAVVLAGRGEEAAPRAAAAAPGPMDPTASGVHGLISAVPFTLGTPYTHWYRAEQPEVDSGWLVALRVNPDRVRPTDAAMPVLYAGSQTVEPVNFGHTDGVVIAIVPDVELLADTDIWFGEPALAETVDATEIARQRTLAAAAGHWTVDAAALDGAREAGGPALALPSRLELEHAAAQMILRHAPGDRDKAEGLLPPR